MFTICGCFRVGLRSVALLSHLAIVRIFANNHDLSKVLLDHSTIVRILVNSSKF